MSRFPGAEVYQTLYSALNLALCLPHMAALTVFFTVAGCITGRLHVHLGHVLFAWLLMARVPFVGISMSACLHRYFAHGAFKTSRPFQAVLALVGCYTYQGGCLWWASKHIRHHKHCDAPNDPHSATQSNSTYAWLGWMYAEHRIDWAYLPKRLLTPELLLINLCGPIGVLVGTCYTLTKWISPEWALFGLWIPSLLSGLASARFNVEYHPDTKQAACKAINRPHGDKGFGAVELPGWAVTVLSLTFKPLVGETHHEDHHDHPRRACRPGCDVPYLAFLRPLESLGLIWDLQDVYVE